MLPEVSIKITQKARALVEVLGWYGFIALLVAYGMVSLNFVPSRSLAYQLLNLSGSVGLAILTFFKKAYQNTLLNVVWGAISIAALIQLVL